MEATFTSKEFCPQAGACVPLTKAQMGPRALAAGGGLAHACSRPAAGPPCPMQRFLTRSPAYSFPTVGTQLGNWQVLTKGARAAHPDSSSSMGDMCTPCSCWAGAACTLCSCVLWFFPPYLGSSMHHASFLYFSCHYFFLDMLPLRVPPGTSPRHPVFSPRALWFLKLVQTKRRREIMINHPRLTQRFLIPADSHRALATWIVFSKCD